MDVYMNSRMLYQVQQLVEEGWRIDVIVPDCGQTGLVMKNSGSYLLMWPGGDEFSYLTDRERRCMIDMAVAARIEAESTTAADASPGSPGGLKLAVSKGGNEPLVDCDADARHQLRTCRNRNLPRVRGRV